MPSKRRSKTFFANESRTTHHLHQLYTSHTTSNLQALARTIDVVTAASLEVDALYLQRLQTSTMLNGLNAMLVAQYSVALPSTPFLDVDMLARPLIDRLSLREDLQVRRDEMQQRKDEAMKEVKALKAVVVKVPQEIKGR